LGILEVLVASFEAVSVVLEFQEFLLPGLKGGDVCSQRWQGALEVRGLCIQCNVSNGLLNEVLKKVLHLKEGVISLLGEHLIKPSNIPLLLCSAPFGFLLRPCPLLQYGLVDFPLIILRDGPLFLMVAVKFLTLLPVSL
jgi:hypothetical protein